MRRLDIQAAALALMMFQAPVSREVTAADVVADLRYMADPANDSWISSVWSHQGGGRERLRPRARSSSA